MLSCCVVAIPNAASSTTSNQTTYVAMQPQGNQNQANTVQTIQTVQDVSNSCYSESVNL